MNRLTYIEFTEKFPPSRELIEEILYDTLKEKQEGALFINVDIEVQNRVSLQLIKEYDIYLANSERSTSNV